MFGITLHLPFVVSCVIIGLILTIISALYMRLHDTDSISLIFAIGLIGSIPIWYSTFRMTDEWLLWILGIALGLANIVILQELTYIICHSEYWQDAVRKILGFIILVGLLVTATVLILANQQNFIDFFSELVSEAKQYK